jgi:hypothetical protein
VVAALRSSASLSLLWSLDSRRLKGRLSVAASACKWWEASAYSSSAKEVRVNDRHFDLVQIESADHYLQTAAWLASMHCVSEGLAVQRRMLDMSLRQVRHCSSAAVHCTAQVVQESLSTPCCERLSERCWARTSSLLYAAISVGLVTAAVRSSVSLSLLWSLASSRLKGRLSAAAAACNWWEASAYSSSKK